MDESKQIDTLGAELGCHTTEKRSNILPSSMTTFQANLNMHTPVSVAVQYQVYGFVEIGICWLIYQKFWCAGSLEDQEPFSMIPDTF